MDRINVSALALVALLSVLMAPARGDEASDPADATIEKGERLEEQAASGSNAPVAEPIAPEEAEAVDPEGEAPLDDPLTCLARAVYWEAKGEDVAAMEAVANVVMNRLAAEDFPDTVCGVVTEGGTEGACQFSWWCDGHSDDVEEPEPYEIAQDVARRSLNQELDDRTEGALFFHASDDTAEWAAKMVETTTVGPHRFYRPAKSTESQH